MLKISILSSGSGSTARGIPNGSKIPALASNLILPIPTNQLLTSLPSNQTVPLPSFTHEQNKLSLLQILPMNSIYLPTFLVLSTLPLFPPTPSILLQPVIVLPPVAPCRHIQILRSSAKSRIMSALCFRKAYLVSQIRPSATSGRLVLPVASSVVPLSLLPVSFLPSQKTLLFPKTGGSGSSLSLAYGSGSPSSWPACMAYVSRPNPPFQKLNTSSLGLYDDLRFW